MPTITIHVLGGCVSEVHGLPDGWDYYVHDLDQLNEYDHRCDNCGKIHSGDDLKPVKDWHERVDEGGPSPSGECPDCGALCYPVETD